MAFNSRYGSDLLQVNPASVRIPAKLKGGVEFGANTLVGIDDATGYAVIPTDGADLSGVVVCVREISTVGKTDGEVRATQELVTNVTVLCEGTGFTDADLFADAYVVDHKTVSTSHNANTRARAGRIVEVVSATRVRVHID